MPLKRAAAITAGQSPPSNDVFDLNGSGQPFLQGNAEFGPLHPEPRLQCDVAPKRAKQGDILLSVRAPVGALNIADRAYGIGRGLCAVSPSRDLNPSFAWWALVATAPQLSAVATGSTYDAVTADDVGQLRIPRLPQSSQRAIADHLDRETARIDALIAAKRQMIKLLEERRQVKLDIVWESLESLAQLKRLVANEKDALIAGPFGSDLAGSDIRSEGPCAVFDQEVAISETFGTPRNYVDDRKAIELSRFAVHPEDVLVTGRGTIGRAVVVPQGVGAGVMHPCLLRVRVNRHRLMPDFFVAYMRWSTRAQDELRLASTATTIDVIYSKTLRELPVPDLSIDKQASLLAEISELVNKVDAAQESLGNQIALLQEHRQALIVAAVTGQLDIPEAA